MSHKLCSGIPGEWARRYYGACVAYLCVVFCIFYMCPGSQLQGNKFFLLTWEVLSDVTFHWLIINARGMGVVEGDWQITTWSSLISEHVFSDVVSLGCVFLKS